MPDKLSINPDIPSPDNNPGLSPESEQAIKEGEKEAKKLGRRDLLLGLGTVAGFGVAATGLYKTFDSDADRFAEKGPSARYLEYLADTEHPNEQRLGEIKEKLAIVIAEYGPGICNTFQAADTKAVDYSKTLPAWPEVNGFEKIGLSGSEIAKFFRPGMYPKNSLAKNVRSITYIDEYIMVPKMYKTDENIVLEGQMFGDGTLKIYRSHPGPTDPKNRDRVDTFGEIAGHEIGHKNAWDNSFYLKGSQRLDFLYEAYIAHKTNISSDNDTLDASWDFQTQKEGLGEKETKLAYLNEWWAVMCSQACETPEDFFGDDETKTHALVKQWFVLNDNKFDFFKAKAARDAALRHLKSIQK